MNKILPTCLDWFRSKMRTPNVVRVCAWTRRVEFRGEWVSFETYLERRFHVTVTHGIAPDEADRVLRQTSRAGSPFLAA
jgi:hypothetical protein